MKIDINSYKEKLAKSLKDLEVKIKSLFNKKDTSPSDQTASIKSTSKGKEGTSTDLNDPVALAKKRKTQVIRFILVGLIIFFIVDMFISKRSEPAPEVVEQTPKGEKQASTPKTDSEVSAEALELQQKFDDSMAREVQKKQDEFKAEEESVDKELEQAKIEAKKVVDEVLAKQGQEPQAVETPEATPAVEPSPTPFETTEVLKPEAETEVETTTETGVEAESETESETGTTTSSGEAETVPEVVQTPAPVETTQVSPDLPITNPPDEAEVPAPIETEVPEVPSTVDSTTGSMDKIIEQVAQEAKKEKLAEVPPMPGFELKGRGLIYNCEQGYWACVTKEDYQKCENLQNWSKENRQAMKCQVSAVFESNGDCTIMQVHYINTLEAQKYCTLAP